LLRIPTNIANFQHHRHHRQQQEQEQERTATMTSYEALSMECDAEDDFMLMMILFERNKTRARLFKWEHNRLNWEESLHKERHQQSFESKYHMSETAFFTLLDMLRDSITVNFIKSRNSTKGNDPIFPELILATGLRFLGGSSHKDLEDIFGMSINSVKRVIKMLFEAILGCDALALKLPETAEEYKTLADDFCERSGAGQIYYGVIGTLDGWLCSTYSPQLLNPAEYFSGHYQIFGVNVQAICDAHISFIYLSVAGPGGMNDIRAIQKCTELLRFIDAMPKQYFLLGDNAYGLSENILIPFSGSQKKAVENDAYNYYLSQLRIRIEQAFGLLTTKWRIFRSPINATLHTTSDIINVASRLHNFVIKEDGDVEIAARDGDEDEQIDSIEGVPNGLLYRPSFIGTMNVHGNSVRRTLIVKEIKEADLRRPASNIERNATGS
jgi:hypothetical protein